MNCKVIAIENQKGGTGKSTTALNLGIGLKMKGKKGLLIDADPQGSLSINLGIKKPEELDVSLATLVRKVSTTNRWMMITVSFDVYEHTEYKIRSKKLGIR